MATQSRLPALLVEGLLIASLLLSLLPSHCKATSRSLGSNDRLQGANWETVTAEDSTSSCTEVGCDTSAEAQVMAPRSRLSSRDSALGNSAGSRSRDSDQNLRDLEGSEMSARLQDSDIERMGGSESEKMMREPVSRQTSESERVPKEYTRAWDTDAQARESEQELRMGDSKLQARDPATVRDADTMRKLKSGRVGGVESLVRERGSDGSKDFDGLSQRETDPDSQRVRDSQTMSDSESGRTRDAIPMMKNSATMAGSSESKGMGSSDRTMVDLDGSTMKNSNGMVRESESEMMRARESEEELDSGRMRETTRISAAATATMEPSSCSGSADCRTSSTDRERTLVQGSRAGLTSKDSSKMDRTSSTRQSSEQMISGRRQTMRQSDSETLESRLATSGRSHPWSRSCDGDHCQPTTNEESRRSRTTGSQAMTHGMRSMNTPRGCNEADCASHAADLQDIQGSSFQGVDSNGLQSTDHVRRLESCSDEHCTTEFPTTATPEENPRFMRSTDSTDMIEGWEKGVATSDRTGATDSSATKSSRISSEGPRMHFESVAGSQKMRDSEKMRGSNLNNRESYDRWRISGGRSVDLEGMKDSGSEMMSDSDRERDSAGSSDLYKMKNLEGMSGLDRMRNSGSRNSDAESMRDSHCDSEKMTLNLGRMRNPGSFVADFSMEDSDSKMTRDSSRERETPDLDRLRNSDMLRDVHRTEDSGARMRNSESWSTKIGSRKDSSSESQMMRGSDSSVMDTERSWTDSDSRDFKTDSSRRESAKSRVQSESARDSDSWRNSEHGMRAGMRADSGSLQRADISGSTVEPRSCHGTSCHTNRDSKRMPEHQSKIRDSEVMRLSPEDSEADQSGSNTRDSGRMQERAATMPSSTGSRSCRWTSADCHVSPDEELGDSHPTDSELVQSKCQPVSEKMSSACGENGRSCKTTATAEGQRERADSEQVQKDRQDQELSGTKMRSERILSSLAGNAGKTGSMKMDPSVERIMPGSSEVHRRSGVSPDGERMKSARREGPITDGIAEKRTSTVPGAESRKSQRMNSERINSERMNAERMNSEGMNTEMMTSQRLFSAEMNSQRMYSDGMNSQRVNSESMSSEGVGSEMRAHAKRAGTRMRNPEVENTRAASTTAQSSSCITGARCRSTVMTSAAVPIRSSHTAMLEPTNEPEMMPSESKKVNAERRGLMVLHERAGNSQMMDRESDRMISSSEAVSSDSKMGLKRMGLAEERPGLCVYTVTTATGKKSGAGTDSTISLRLLNKEGNEAYFPSLDNSKNNFEKGQMDHFQLQGDCISHICKMILYTDNSGYLAAWFVDSIGISVNTAAGKEDRTWQLKEWLPTDDSSASLFLLRDDCH